MSQIATAVAENGNERMNISTQDKIDLLTIHRENLLKTRTFEEYRNAHVAYIEMLIEQLNAEKLWIASTENFVHKEF